jgi:hypothetical protein
MTNQEKLQKLIAKADRQEKQIISWACGIDILKTLEEIEELKKQIN